ncbi:uncharacterized protein LOC111628251 [Centruroides sculpturatus]|uniref:uncharacterized protein LOC111628251 n=1 Tax=Centruroides sculpturatus TaxID=218467 RepID=UPI000C6D3525|nr:uncharacterized protein LOC111628251 [Centruroides sculpturatus]
MYNNKLHFMSFFINKEEVKIVKEIKFLGVTFTPNLSFEKHYKNSLSKAKIAINNLIGLFCKAKMKNIRIHFQLFNSIVMNSMGYATPIWSMEKFNDFEKIQNIFIRKIFQLEYNIPGSALRLETHRFRINTILIKRYLKFLLKIIKAEDITTKLLFLLHHKSRETDLRRSWIIQLSKIVNKYGFSIKLFMDRNYDIEQYSKEIIHRVMEYSIIQDVEDIRKRENTSWYATILNYPVNNNYILTNIAFNVKKFFIQIRLNKYGIIINDKYIDYTQSKCPNCTKNLSKIHILCENCDEKDKLQRLQIGTLAKCTSELEMYKTLDRADDNTIYKLYNYVKQLIK